MEVDLQAIRERAEKATQGPWKVVGKDNWHLKEFPQVEMNTPDGKYFSVHCDADADFIAHARQDIPALLEYVSRLTEVMYSACKVSLDLCETCDLDPKKCDGFAFSNIECPNKKLREDIRSVNPKEATHEH